MIQSSLHFFHRRWWLDATPFASLGPASYIIEFGHYFCTPQIAHPT